MLLSGLQGFSREMLAGYEPTFRETPRLPEAGLGARAPGLSFCGRPGDRPDEIWAQRGNEYVRLRVGEIERVESERDYVHIHNGERAYLLRATLKDIHARLGLESYLRIHRSAIVRVDRIAAIRDRGYGHIQVMLESGATMRVGRTYLKRIRSQLKGRADMPATPPHLRLPAG